MLYAQKDAEISQYLVWFVKKMIAMLIIIMKPSET